MSYEYDIEKSQGLKQGNGYEVDPGFEKRHGSVVDEGHAVPGESFVYGNSLYAKIQRVAGKFHVEQRGIERVPEDERVDRGFKALLNTSTMWLAANMVVSSFGIGVLAVPVFGLAAVDSMLVILFFNLLGILPVCFFSSFGPMFGLRQMVLSRFWFGWYGVKLIALFNVLACIGWSAVNALVGAQLINAVNTDVPGFAGILIIAICTLLVTFFGYKVVHAYEFWSWIPTFIVFLIVLGVFAHSGDFVPGELGVGQSEAGSVLSFGSVVFGFATGWTSYAADYTVYQPSTQSKKSVFFWTWIGLIIPLLFTEMLGAAIATTLPIFGIPDAPNNPRYTAAYYGPDGTGIGGLVGAVLIYHLGTFGKFCTVVLALSIIANNCPNIYSVALTAQVMARWTQRVPRFLWTFLATCVYIAVAIPAYSNFEESLTYFLDFIGYWLAIYEAISLSEHFVFRRGFQGYRPEDYDVPGKLPPGIAAIIAFCCGIAGMVVGMSQVWWVGPLGLLAGEPPFGGDIGFELAFGFALVGYLILRPIEKRIFGR